MTSRTAIAVIVKGNSWHPIPDWSCYTLQGKEIAVAGRVMARRFMGKLAFMSLTDDSGSIQIYLDKAVLDAAEEGTFKCIPFLTLHNMWCNRYLCTPNLCRSFIVFGFRQVDMPIRTCLLASQALTELPDWIPYIQMHAWSGRPQDIQGERRKENN